MTKETEKAGSKQDANGSPDIKDIIQYVDKDFQNRYWRTLTKHYLLDIIFSILFISILILVSITLIVIQPLLTSEAGDASLPILLTSIAVLISFVSLMLRWITTPMSSKEDYIHDLSKKNCEHISAKHKIPNDIVLIILVKMKAIDHKTKLMNVYSLSPNLFLKDELVKRYYDLK